MNIEPRSKKGQRDKKTIHPKQPVSKKKKFIILGIIIALIALAGCTWYLVVKPPQMNLQDTSELPPDTNRADGVYSVLVVGTDKVGLNTDTIFVVSFDTVKNKASVLSIPRDTMSDVERKVKKINAAYSVGGKANIDQLKKEIKNLIGFAPDNYIVVNLDAFVQVIDAIGGVSIDVPRNMDYEDPYQDLSIHLKKGQQVLNGQQAVGFVRYRKGYVEGDMGRVKAQQLFMEALAKQLAQPSTLTKLPKLTEIVSTNMKTDLTVGEMIWFGKQGVELNIAEDLQMFVLPGEAQTVLELSYYIPNEAEILQMVNEHFNPYDKAIAKLNVVNLDQIKKAAPITNKPQKVDPEIEKEKNQEKLDMAGESKDKDEALEPTSGDKTTNDQVTDDKTTTDKTTGDKTTDDKTTTDKLPTEQETDDTTGIDTPPGDTGTTSPANKTELVAPKPESPQTPDAPGAVPTPKTVPSDISADKVAD